MSGWIDISQPLSPAIAHWPGDTPFSYKLTNSIKDTGSVNIGKIETSVHIGTHIDAPFHFTKKGKTVEQLPIDTYIGKVMVLDVSCTNEINANILKKQPWTPGIKRVLLHTSLINQPERFPVSIPYLDPDIAPFLQARGVTLLGVDMPSVDDIKSKTLPTHHALNKHGISILENLLLNDITPGIYQFIALPLKIIGADGSPVRAVIRPLTEEGKQDD